jgi:hypothetical protein
MSETYPLRPALKRGAIVTAANWPVVLLQFVAESNFKLLVGVPVVGGVVLVGLALGRDVGDLLRGDLRSVAAEIGTGLLGQPLAFAAFVSALAISILGGAALAFLVKGGTVTVLVRGEAQAAAVERPPLRLEIVAGAMAYSIETFTTGARRLFTRYVALGLTLIGAYVASGGAYLALVLWALPDASEQASLLAWTLLAAGSSSVLLVWITLVNFVYLILQLVIAAEDCSVGASLRRAAGFLRSAGRDVLLVFAVILGLVVLATAASLVATAGLGLISFVPLVGLAAFPLQAAAWLVRGLLFQYLELTALSAYSSLHRRWRAAAAGAASLPSTSS